MVCLRSFSLTANGVIRVHGPVQCRCPGSGKPPRQVSIQAQSVAIPSLAATRDCPEQLVSVSGSDSTLGLASSIESIPAVRVLGWIPKAARHQCCLKFVSILNDVQDNSIQAWNRLFQFAARCLRVPHRLRQRGRQGFLNQQSLASIVKEQIVVEGSPPFSGRSRRRREGKGEVDHLNNLARRVTMKIEEGDLRGAVRLASSEDVLAEHNKETYRALQSRHPLAHSDSCIPPSTPVF